MAAVDMISALPTTSDESSFTVVPDPLFKLEHIEFFCGKIPVKVYFERHSGLHYVSIDSSSTNLTDVSIRYVTHPYPNGIPNVTSQLALTGTQTGFSSDRFEYYMGNAFSPNSVEIDVKADQTAFSFNLIGGSSGYIQLLNLLLESLSTVTFGERDFKHQVFNSEDFSGKLYEKLQEEESRLENVVEKARRLHVFHGSIYQSDHIGGSEDLTKSNCTLSKVIQYFQYFYQNPWIMVSGNMPDFDLNILDGLSLKYSYTKHNNSNVMMGNYAELISSIPDVQFHYTDVVTVCGTSHDSADKGILQIGFLGESPTNVTFIEAIDVLSEYLCSAHLNELLTKGKDPICSSVSIELKIAFRCEVVVNLSGVHKCFLNKGTVERLFNCLKTIRWDLQQLHEIVIRKIRSFNELTENNVSQAVFERLSIFQLYASDKTDSLLLKRLLNPALVLGELLQLSTAYWQKFIESLFVENCVVVIGVPDPNTTIQQHILNRQLVPPPPMNRDKKLRRSTELLKEFFKPDDVLSSQEIVDVSAVSVFPFHKIFPTTLKPFHWSITGNKLNLLPGWFKSFKQLFDPPPSIPITVYPLESEFIKAVFLFDVRKVDLRLRHYIFVFTKLVFKSASFVDGNFTSTTELERSLWNEVLKHECSLGFGDHPYVMQLTLKVVSSKLELIEKWFSAALCNAVFDPRDVVSAVNEVLLCGRKHRDGADFCNKVLDSVNFDRHKERFYANEIRLEPFHSGLMEMFLNGSYQQIMDDIHMLRNQLLNSKISLNLVGNPAKFSSIRPVSFEDLKRFQKSNKIEKVTIDQDELASIKWPSIPEIHIIGIKEIRSSACLVERLPFSCEPFDDSHAALLIFCTYFSTKGGIFDRCIKEDGQAKLSSISFNIHTRTLTLTLIDVKNLKPTRQLVSYLLRTTFIDSIDMGLFKVSRRLVASRIVEAYSNIESAGSLSIHNDTNGWTIDQITSFIHKILVIKQAHCQVLLYDMIAQLSTGKNLMAIACPSYQMTHMKQNFQDILHPSLLCEHRDNEVFELSTS